MRRIIFALAASIIAVGCANVTVDEPSICDGKSLTSLPSVSSGDAGGVSLPSVSFTQQLDLSSTLSKINNVADDVSIQVTQMVLDNTSGNMSWVTEVDVDIAANGMQSQRLVHYMAQPGDQSSSSLNLPILLGSGTMYSYLSSGPVLLTFTLSGSVPSQTPELTGTMCINASASKQLSL